jgi:hypothetical protein
MSRIFAIVFGALIALVLAASAEAGGSRGGQSTLLRIHVPQAWPPQSPRQCPDLARDRSSSRRSGGANLLLCSGSSSRVMSVVGHARPIDTPSAVTACPLRA